MDFSALRKQGNTQDVCGCSFLRGSRPSVSVGVVTVLLKSGQRSVLDDVRPHGALLAPGTGVAPDRLRKASQAAAVARLSKLTLKWEGRLRRAFLNAVKQLKKDLDVTALADAIGSGAMDVAYRVVDEALAAHGFKKLQEEFNAAVTAGATVGSSLGLGAMFGEGSTPGAVQFSFDVANPRTVEFLRRYGGDKVAELIDGQRTVLRSVITDGFFAGNNPLTVARTIRDYVGLTESQAATVSRFTGIVANGELPDGSPATLSDYLGYELRDRRFDGTVRAYLGEDGPALSAEQVQRIAGQYASRYVDFRADTIGRTEGIRAVNAGNLELWQQAEEDGKVPDDLEVRRYWVFTDDDRVREAHTEIPSMNPDGVGLEEPFQTPLGDLMYPGDPDGDPANTINCRCLVIYEMRPKEA